MTCPRCHQWIMRRGYDGDYECFCGHVQYATPPLTYDEAAALPRRGTSYDSPVPAVRPKPSAGQMAQISFAKSFK